MSSNTLFAHSTTPIYREPDNPRQSMEPEADMSPQDARTFLRDLEEGMYGRVKQMPDDDFRRPERYNKHGQPRLPNMEKAKQHYKNHKWQLLAGIVAACREWSESKKDIEKMKEKYSGEFVRGVEIGERLAVFEDRDFSFSVPENDGGDDDGADESSSFTFTA